MDKEAELFLSEFSEKLNNGNKIIVIPPPITERINEDCRLKIENFAYAMNEWRQKFLNSETIRITPACG
jgi:hypothetical protein